MKIFGLNIQRDKKENSSGVTQGWATNNIFGNTATWNRTTRSDLANNFAPVNQIISDIYSRDIYAVDEAGDRLPLSLAPGWFPILYPNSRMGMKKFITTLISGYLTLPEMSILAYHRERNSDGEIVDIPGAPKGGFKADSISGFTILPRGSRYNMGAREVWRVYTPNGVLEVGPESVITLKYGVLPDDGYTGISPGSASHNEAQILDYLSQQQRAFFEKGATPTVVATIYARSAEESIALKNNFQNSYKGAANSGGTIFQTVISDGIQGDGGPHIAIENLTPANNTLAVETLNTWAQGAIDANQGVSPLIYGKLDAATYDTEKTARARFYAQTDSVLERFLNDFIFELNRITNDTINWNFGFEKRDMEVTGEQKTIADTRVANANAYVNLIKTGATAEQVQKALALPIEFSELKVDLTVSQPAQSLIPEPAPPPSQNAKTGKKTTVADRRPDNHEQIKATLTKFAQAKITKALSGSKNALDPSDQKYINQLLVELQDMADEGGSVTARQLAQEIKGQVVNQNYDISAQTLQNITDRAKKVMEDFGDYVNDQTDQYMSDPDQAKQSKSSILDDLLTGVIAYKIGTIVTMEGKNAFESGQIDNAKQISQTYNVSIVKTWGATGSSPCEFCQAMDGKEAGIDDSFVPGGVINADDGQSLILDSNYSDGTMPDAHVNCQCSWAFTVEK